MHKAKILVVDDERTIRDTVCSYLLQDGYEVVTASDGPSAMQTFHSYQPDLVVLDIMLPGLDGLEVLQRLRHESNVFVLMLTARSEETDRIVGLKMGADDYLTKPFSPRELVARVQAILRRGRGLDREEHIFILGYVRVDTAARQVWIDEIRLELTPIEFDLILVLARNRNRVLSREQLIEHVWGYDYYGDERVVDVHIGRLRKKIEAVRADVQPIITVRGVGYRFEEEPG